MSLVAKRNKETAAQTAKPEFENEEGTAQQSKAAAEPQPETKTEVKPEPDRIVEAATVHSKALTVKAQGTVSTNLATKLTSPLDTVANAFHVDWNTLPALKMTQGNFVTKPDGDKLGESIGLELLSFQDNFVLSTGEDSNDEEAAKYVRYSDDGVTTKDGVDCKAYIQEMVDAGYEKANTSKRLVIVGALFDAGKQTDLLGQLVQIDLPPTSMAKFNSYKIQAAFDSARKGLPARASQFLRIDCDLVSKGKNTWTTGLFKTDMAAYQAAVEAEAKPAN